TVSTALVVALAWAAAEAPARGIHASAAWPFALAGLLQPGVGQLFATLAIRETGSSRASMVFGTAPLVSVAIALVFLGEPASAPPSLPALAPVRARRHLLRALVRRALRGVLPRARHGRLAARRHRVARRRGALGAALPTHRARRPPTRPRGLPHRGRGSAHRR